MKKFDKIQVATISFAHFTHDIYSSFLAPLLPLIIERYGVSLTMSSLLEIVRRFPALFNPFVGMLAERSDVKWFVILAPTITALSMSFLGLASNYAMILFLLFIAGISAVFFHVPTPTIVKNNSGNRVGLGMSMFMVGGESARAIGPLIVTGAISIWGFEGIWRLSFFGVLVSVILYFRLKNFTNFKAKEVQKGDYKKILKEFAPFFTIIGIFIFLQSLTKIFTTLYLAVYLTDNGFSLWYATFAISLLQFFAIIGTFLGGYLSDKFGKKEVLYASTFLIGVSMIGFITFSHSLVMFLFLALLGIFIFASAPILLALVQELKSDKPTFLNSVYMTLSFSVSSLSALCFGFMGDKIGMNYAIIIATLLSFVAVGFVWLLFRVAKSYF
jgi:FSR family fosmidomycin resistance protein-like MFS transporter